MSTITADQRVSQAVRVEERPVPEALEWGGFGAGAVLVAFGIVAIIMGFSGRATVADSLRAGEDCRQRRHDSRADRQGSEGRRSRGR